MTVSLFDQFSSHSFLGIPIIILAFTFPWLFFPKTTNRLITNRMHTAYNWLLSQVAYQMFGTMSLGGRKWAALLTSLMLFLMTMNLFGLLPYTFTPTSQLSVSLALAAPMWLATVILGIRKDLSSSLAHLLPPGTPKALIPILIIIETASLLIRPIALGVRLTANVTAGHLLIQLISIASLHLSSTTLPLAFLTSILLFLLSILEIAVALIQAYVFSLLLSLYLEENVK